MDKVMKNKKKQILFVPDGWPANFFYDQMDAVSDLYNFEVLLGNRVPVGKKKFLKNILSKKLSSFSIEKTDIYRVSYNYINYSHRFFQHRQWSKLLKKFDVSIRRIYNGGKPDIIHIHQISDTAAFICDWAAENNVPVIMSEHLLYVSHENYDFYSIKKDVYSKVSKVLCASNYQYRTLLTNGVKMKNVDVVGNLLDDSFVLETFTYDKNNRNIMFVASHLADKDIDVLLDAIAILKERNYIDFHLDIIGINPDQNYPIEDNPEYNLQQDIKRRGLTGIISLKGRKERIDLLKCYQYYSFLVSSSLSETFGVGVAEAIMNGLPVVCTDSGGVRDFVDCTNGLIVPIHNPQAFSDAIVKMFELRRFFNSTEMSNQIRSRFGRDSFRERLLNVYQELLDFKDKA
jgi:glycosyltransferase involved in cell wall biosynthesis